VHATHKACQGLHISRSLAVAASRHPSAGPQGHLRSVCSQPGVLLARGQVAAAALSHQHKEAMHNTANTCTPTSGHPQTAAKHVLQCRHSQSVCIRPGVHRAGGRGISSCAQPTPQTSNAQHGMQTHCHTQMPHKQSYVGFTATSSTHPPLTMSVQPARRAHGRWKWQEQLRSAHLRLAPCCPQRVQRVARPRWMALGRCIWYGGRVRQQQNRESRRRSK
jgi:hypothetical protein